MYRCWVLLGIGAVVILFGGRISRWHHLEYLRRSRRDAAEQKAYLRLWDWRTERFGGIVIGLGFALVGLVCLAAAH